MDDGKPELRLVTSPTFEETPAKALPDWSQMHRELKRPGVTLLLLWAITLTRKRARRQMGEYEQCVARFLQTIGDGAMLERLSCYLRTNCRYLFGRGHGRTGVDHAILLPASDHRWLEREAFRRRLGRRDRPRHRRARGHGRIPAAGVTRSKANVPFIRAC